MILARGKIMLKLAIRRNRITFPSNNNCHIPENNENELLKSRNLVSVIIGVTKPAISNSVEETNSQRK